MDKQLRSYLQNSLIFLDFFVLNTAYLFARIFFEKKIPSDNHEAYLQLLIVINMLWFVVFFGARTYSASIIINFESFIKRTSQVYLLWIIAILLYLFITREFEVSRLFTFFIIITFAVGLVINRFLYLVINNYLKKRNHLFNKVIIIGYNETAKKLENYFDEESINTRLLGFIEEEINIKELSRHPVLGGLDTTMKNAIEMDVQEIYSTITPEQNNYIYTLMNKAEMECIRFKIVPDLSIFINQPVVINYIGTMPILSTRSEPLDDVGNRVKKRALDVLVSIFVLIFILSWLIPIIGLLIYLESKGPVFFKQLRSGKNNKTFFCYKFRSMRVNRDSDLQQATKNDKRITKLGKFLRKTSLDEFPQFINVLKGEMSLVGPRPHMVKHTNDYSKIVDQYMIRHFLKPGITGWAQVNGYRGEITETEQIQKRVSHDLWYLENWNIWMDIRILFITIYQVLRGDENAF
jgi:putative colanic acid biosynthesis UDP-glucose lipid carrier transferase